MTPALSLLCCALSLAQSPAQTSYETANRLFTEKKFPESYAAIEQALRDDPKFVPALTLKAKLAMAMNRYDVARASLEDAIAADPTAWYAQFLYGFQFYMQNEMQRALLALEKAAQLNPRDARPVQYLGLTLESLGRFADAILQYRKAIQLEEQVGKLQADTLLICARLLFLLDRLEESRPLIERAVKLDPASRDARFEFARLLLKQGDVSGAAREGEAALRATAGGVSDPQVHYLLIRVYKKNGDETRAAGHVAALRLLE